MKFFPYKTRNLKGALLYVPKETEGPFPLVIWLTGGNDGAQQPLQFSLGKLLNEGAIKPNCAVLMPAASHGHNYTTMTRDELLDLVCMAGEEANLDYRNISICGWDLGADAAAILVMKVPDLFDRICLISNYPEVWSNYKVRVPVLMLIGAKEKSAKRDWSELLERMPNASLLIANNYGHEIGEKIWADEGGWLFRWLTGGGACYQTLR